MGRKSYEVLAQEAGMTVEEYKAKKATPTTPAPVAVKAPSVDGDTDHDDSADDDGSVDVGEVKLVDQAGCWGIVYGKQRHVYVTLLNRNYYAEETTGTKGRGAGKVYAAGTYGPWKLAEAMYPNTDARAVEIVAESLYRAGMADEAADLDDYGAQMRKAWLTIREEMIGAVASRSFYTGSKK